jgi:hypothetical protein
MSQRSPEEILKELEEQALEDDAREVAAMSNAELNAELARAGIDPKKATEPLQALRGRDLRGGSKTAQTAPSVPKRPRRFSAWPAALAAAAGLVAVFSLQRSREQTVAHGRDSAPTQPSSQPTPREQAAKLREEAYAACDQGRWAVCLQQLDTAKALDPESDSDPRVQRARNAAQGAMRRQ